MKWFAIQYDRNYQTSEYGNGNEIYIEEKSNNQNNTFRTDLRKPVVDVNVKTTSD